MKKLLAMFLMMTLVVSPTQAKADTVENEEFKVPEIVTDDDVSKITEDNSLKVTFNPTEKLSQSVKVTLKKGAIASNVTLAEGNKDGVNDCNLILDDDADPATTPDYKHYYNESENQFIIVPEDGEYYIRYQMIRKNFDDGETYVYNALVYNVTSKDKAIKNKVSMVSFTASDDDVIYYKVVSKQCSTLALAFNSSSKYGPSLDTTLCDSKKKEISQEMHIYPEDNEDTVITEYVLDKGTYYIKVNKSGTGYYMMTPLLTKRTPTGGSSFAKAKALKFNKEMKGVLPAKSNAKGKGYTYYYKFTLDKAKSFKITIAGYTADQLTFKLYDKDKKRVVTSGYNEKKPFEFEFTPFGSWSKGTYYIAVSSSDKAKQGNGDFTIKIQ